MAEEEKDDPQIREVFARFGRAMYLAGTLEMGLTNALLQVVFLAEARRHFLQMGKFPDKYDANFDAFMETQQKRTMGQLVGRLRETGVLEAELVKRVDVAVDRRNFLAHHFWRERAEAFLIPRKRDEMIAELMESADLFEGIKNDLHEALRTGREEMGVKDETINARIKTKIEEVRNS